MIFENAYECFLYSERGQIKQHHQRRWYSLPAFTSSKLATTQWQYVHLLLY